MKLSELDNLQDHTPVNPFYISFSDLMVLLCVFFVLILGMSKIEIGSFEKLRTGITGDTKGTLVELHSTLKVITREQNGINVELAKDGVRVDLDTTVLFDTGSSILKKDSLVGLGPVLTKVLHTTYHVDVEGHTDDVPLFKILGEERESNWSLSGRRAASMVHHLQEFGFPDERIRLVGYAATRPKVPVKGLTPNRLDQARAQNRRVSLLIR